MRSIVAIILSLSFFTFSCSIDPVFPEEPMIEYLDIQPRVVRHLQDSIVITFKFQDGDGNLGAEDESEDFNLVLIDSRINNGLTEAQATNKFTLPNLSPDARNPSIQGEMTVKLDFTANTAGQTDEDFRYQIKLIDRDGNEATPINGGETNIYTDYIKVIR